MKAYAKHEGGWGNCRICGKIGSWYWCHDCDIDVRRAPAIYDKIICRECRKNYCQCKCKDKKDRVEKWIKPYYTMFFWLW